MGTFNPPVKNAAFVVYLALEDAANPGTFLVNPPIAAGDFKVKKDGGAPANLTTLPAVDNVAEVWVKVSLSATEMNADSVKIQGVDQTSPKAWTDVALCVLTT